MIECDIQYKVSPSDIRTKTMKFITLPRIGESVFVTSERKSFTVQDVQHEPAPAKSYSYPYVKVVLT